MATHAAQPYAPPSPPTEPEHRGVAGPVMGGLAMIVVGGIFGFGSIVGYAFADKTRKGWDRLAHAESFGLPSTVTTFVGVALIALGLVMIGVGIGHLRRRRA